ncbi:MAG: phospholipase D-like domain-containing protein, partial [Arenimonas sp.]
MLCLGACTHVSRHEKLQAEQYADRARSSAVSCAAGCAITSPLRSLGDAAYAASRPAQPRHKVLMLDSGQDSLLARVHLIRSARTSIDLQTFHFERDDAGRVVLDELRAASARGVRVRLLMDQLNSLTDPQLQATLAGFHRNFEMRLYNPVFVQARVSPFEFAGAVLFRFRNLNQRMHSKLMLIDGRVAILGGRNIQDEYFDWNDQYNYRDRDVLIAGPVTQEMTRYFDAFWNDRRAVPAARLDDVARVLVENRGPPPAPLPPRSTRVVAMAAAAGDGEQVFARLSPYLYNVGRVDFFGDLPSKHADSGASRSEASQALLNAFAASEQELLLQTPYLVLSRPARRVFRALQRRPQPVTVWVSTNSLAATDAFPVYAMSHKY